MRDGVERERERERKEVRGARERAKREQEKQTLLLSKLQLTLGALGTLTILRASPAALTWTCL